MNIYLMANDYPGVEVAKYLVECGDTIQRLYLHSEKMRKRTDEIVKYAGVSEEQIYPAAAAKDLVHMEEAGREPPDFIITVYWSFLILPEFFKLAKSTVNFHPAMLPINRGWYPHVHSFLDGSPTGVTLHQIDETADTGLIWAQKLVPIRDTDTAFEIYNRLQDEIIQLFKDTWPTIKKGGLTPFKQDESKAVYHAKSEINGLDKIDLNATYTGSQIISVLRARSFGSKGFAYYEKDGKKIYLNIRLSETPDFE